MNEELNIYSPLFEEDELTLMSWKIRKKAFTAWTVSLSRDQIPRCDKNGEFVTFNSHEAFEAYLREVYAETEKGRKFLKKLDKIRENI
jgi:hypothetical protein